MACVSHCSEDVYSLSYPGTLGLEGARISEIPVSGTDYRFLLHVETPFS